MPHSLASGGLNGPMERLIALNPSMGFKHVMLMESMVSLVGAFASANESKSPAANWAQAQAIQVATACFHMRLLAQSSKRSTCATRKPNTIQQTGGLRMVCSQICAKPQNDADHELNPSDDDGHDPDDPDSAEESDDHFIKDVDNTEYFIKHVDDKDRFTKDAVDEADQLLASTTFPPDRYAASAELKQTAKAKAKAKAKATATDWSISDNDDGDCLFQWSKERKTSASAKKMPKKMPKRMPKKMPKKMPMIKRMPNEMPMVKKRPSCNDSAEMNKKFATIEVSTLPAEARLGCPTCRNSPSGCNTCIAKRLGTHHMEDIEALLD